MQGLDSRLLSHPAQKQKKSKLKNTLLFKSNRDFHFHQGKQYQGLTLVAKEGGKSLTKGGKNLTDKVKYKYKGGILSSLAYISKCTITVKFHTFYGCW